MDDGLVYERLEYFLRFGNEKRGSEEWKGFWKLFNPAGFGFKRSRMTTKKMMEDDER